MPHGWLCIQFLLNFPFLTVITQSRQSARHFLQLSELGLPHPPSTQAGLPPLASGVGHTCLRERGWGGVPIPREDRHCGTLGIYVCCEWFSPCAACPVCPWAACPCPVADAPPPPPVPAVAAPSPQHRIFCHQEIRAGIFKQSMGARHRVGIGLSYRPARLAELIPWNRFLGSINV